MKYYLTKNELKLLAAAAMLLDHIGAELLPQLAILRIIGRLAFPIFAFSVYEGCGFTRDRKKYQLQMLGLGLACVAGYYIYAGVLYANVLITFSLSISMLCGLRVLEDSLRRGEKAAALPFAAALAGAALICRYIEVDYGFSGVLLPVWAELFVFAGEQAGHGSPEARKRFALTGLGAGLLLLAGASGGYQIFSLAALLPLALSSGQRGTLNLKNFFYLFYPAHLLVIGAFAVFAEV